MTLTEQYLNGAITPREYVERVWESTDEYGTRFHPVRIFGLRVELFKSWQAAAAFTFERMEQIRQINREIEVLITILPSESTWKMLSMNQDRVRDYVLFVTPVFRIIAREQTALDEMTKGIRKEAL